MSGQSTKTTKPGAPKLLLDTSAAKRKTARHIARLSRTVGYSEIKAEELASCSPGQVYEHLATCMAQAQGRQRDRGEGRPELWRAIASRCEALAEEQGVLDDVSVLAVCVAATAWREDWEGDESGPADIRTVQESMELADLGKTSAALIEWIETNQDVHALADTIVPAAIYGISHVIVEHTPVAAGKTATEILDLLDVSGAEPLAYNHFLDEEGYQAITDAILIPTRKTRWPLLRVSSERSGMANLFRAAHKDGWKLSKAAHAHVERNIWKPGADTSWSAVISMVPEIAGRDEVATLFLDRDVKHHKWPMAIRNLLYYHEGRQWAALANRGVEICYSPGATDWEEMIDMLGAIKGQAKRVAHTLERSDVIDWVGSTNKELRETGLAVLQEIIAAETTLRHGETGRTAEAPATGRRP